jgi:2-polyprenyl-6-methoxyphenol hydroxylase-like FAD-dependent oxidoreductase
MWPALEKKGYAFSELGLRAPNADATVLAVIPDARTGGEDLPATLGIFRPDFAAVLRERALEAGVKFRYNTTVTEVSVGPGAAATARTADGDFLTYDLLVGADGLHSAVRTAIGIQGTPAGTGMGAWRAFVPRPTEVTRTDLIYGGPAYIAGYCPTGPDTMYAYLVEDAQERDLNDGARIMAGIARLYGGPWQQIASSINDSTPVHYTRFTSYMVQGPWYRGRVVLAGDAAHNCPPTIAQGAAMAVEDAAVLADEILQAKTFDENLLQRYQERREPRARAVVEASVQLGQWMLDGKKDADVPGLMHQVATTVSVPV